MERIEEEQTQNVRTMLNANFERRFITRESNLARLIDLLVGVHSNNNNQRQHHDGEERGFDASSSSHSISFKVEEKVEIPTFGGEVDDDKLNNWLNQLEVYIQIQGVLGDVNKISFARLKMDGHALIWWETHVETLKYENQPKVYSWEEFKIF